MKVKKWLLGLVTFAAMVVVCAVCAGAETYGDFNYSVLDDGTVKITKYNGSAKTVDIPAKIDGMNVTGIRSSVFRNYTNLTSITIPDSVTEIDSSAFEGCTSLTAISIATGNQNYVSVNGVLYNKDKTTIICYPAGKKDKNYTITDGAMSIGYSAFYGCTSLTSITIPNSVTSIADSAFYGCTSLTSMTIPNSVTSISDNAFANCTSLTAINIATENQNYVSVNGVLYNKDRTTIICYPEGKKDKNYEIIDGVTDIGSGAFLDCTSLTSITIPNSVTTIGSSAFGWCTSLISITIPDGVMSINYGTFSCCTNLESVIIPDGVTSIDWYAFIDCTSLKSITIPGSVTSISNGAFLNCTNLTSITIPKSVATIGSFAFGCYDNGFEKIDNFKIYCYPGTAGEQYAKDYGFTYELLDNPALAKVTGAKLTGRAADALRINWSKNASADGYIVEMYQNGKWARVAKITNNSTTTFRKAGLKASTVYKFRVRAYKMSGKTALYSNYSATVTARTNPSVIKGAKLTGRAADALRINWSKNASADGYIVEMYQGNKWVRVAKITSNNTTTFRKAGLKASSVYKFRVRAYKMSGKTALYGNYSTTVTARTNPSIVKGVKIGGKAKDALRVNWTKNASAQGYIVEMYKGGKWVRVAKITNNSTTTFRKAGLAKNTTYKFRVRAYHMSGKTALYGNYGSVSGKTAAK